MKKEPEKRELRPLIWACFDCATATMLGTQPQNLNVWIEGTCSRCLKKKQVAKPKDFRKDNK